MGLLRLIQLILVLVVGVNSTDGDENGTKRNNENNNQQPQRSTNSKQVLSLQDREAEGRHTAKKTLKLGSTERCEWSEPMNIVKGKLCGAYYKVLGLDRSLGKVDKNGVKKAYRGKSLLLHPDKNPAPEASSAFKLLTEAYECLSDEVCLQEYEQKLIGEEYAIQEFRHEIKEKVIQQSKNVLAHIHYYISLACSHTYSMGLDIWEMAGEFEVDIFGANHKIGQYALMAVLVLTQARLFLYAHAFSYLVSRFNYELAKQQGMF